MEIIRQNKRESLVFMLIPPAFIFPSANKMIQKSPTSFFSRAQGNTGCVMLVRDRLERPANSNLLLKRQQVLRELFSPHCDLKEVNMTSWGTEGLHHKQGGVVRAPLQRWQRCRQARLKLN